MTHHLDDTTDELNLTNKKPQTLERLVGRLGVLETQIQGLTLLQSMNSSLSAENIQEVVTKISALRSLIDKIEVEMEQLNSRINDIESLRFKSRSE
jgi:uncharacterized phage infection (PIP) family protein YhgE